MSNELRQKAIRLLARREHTRAELARKLAAHGTPEEIAAVLAELQASQLQSDTRAAESYVRSHADRLGCLAPAPEPEDPRRDRRTDRRATGAGRLARRTGTCPRGLAQEVSRGADRCPGVGAPGALPAGRGFASDVIRRLLKEPAGATD
jgi:regulatory protein